MSRPCKSLTCVRLEDNYGLKRYSHSDWLSGTIAACDCVAATGAGLE